jgi:fibro-slime domain-containing protein
MRCPSPLRASALIYVVVSTLLGVGCSASGDDSSEAKNASGKGPVLGSTGGSGGVSLPGGGNGPVLEEAPPMVPDEECEAVIELTLRDFDATHPDFEAYNGGSNDVGCGMVAPDLGAGAKPVFVAAIGTQKRITTGDFEHLVFASCADWDWMPAKVVTDQASFDQWYRDVPGVNQTFKVSVPLTDAGDGNLAYDSSAFFPLDNMGFGNTPNQQHNYHFTTEAHMRFGYIAGQKFTFRGDDDLWIFVNGKLALDLGGMHAPIAATIDFDTQASALGIQAGGTYQMDIFHAERHTSQSNFRIETNIRCFEPVVVK